MVVEAINLIIPLMILGLMHKNSILTKHYSAIQRFEDRCDII